MYHISSDTPFPYVYRKGVRRVHLAKEEGRHLLDLILL